MIHIVSFVSCPGEDMYLWLTRDNRLVVYQGDGKFGEVKNFTPSAGPWAKHESTRGHQYACPVDLIVGVIVV